MEKLMLPNMKSAVYDQFNNLKSISVNLMTE